MDRGPRWRGTLIIGSAIFAIYLGADDVISAPVIGSQAGDRWAPALVGMTLTCVALPILAVVSLETGTSVRVPGGPGRSLLISRRVFTRLRRLPAVAR